jgi:hypothetical protein
VVTVIRRSPLSVRVTLQIPTRKPGTTSTPYGLDLIFAVLGQASAMARLLGDAAATLLPAFGPLYGLIPSHEGRRVPTIEKLREVCRLEE